MRKWIRIAAAALLLLPVFLVPWSETEVHKRRCQAAWSRLQGKSFTQRAKAFYYRITKTTPRRGHWAHDDLRQLSNSREALVELGYLVRQRFVLKNGPTEAEEAFYRERPPDAFTCIDWNYRNTLWIIARHSEMAAVSNIVRRIDERAK